VVEVYLPVRITEISDNPAPVIGLVLGVSGVITAIATFASARLVDEHGGMRWFMPMMLLAAVSTLGIAVVSDVWLLGLLTCVRALPFAAAATLLVAHLTQVVPPSEQTVVLSLTPLPRNSAMFAVPILAAVVAPFGVGLALAVGALSYVVAGLTGWLAVRATPAEIARLRVESERQSRSAGTATGP
jgi:MFS family permease